MDDSLCEGCLYFCFEQDCCLAPIDEDELARLLSGERCPYFRAGDDYTIVRAQN